MGRSEPDSGSTGEEGTLRWIVCVAAAAVGLAVHDATAGQPPTTRWMAAACAAALVGGVGLTVLNAWLKRFGATPHPSSPECVADRDRVRHEVDQLTHAQACDAVLDVIGRGAGNFTLPPDVPEDVRQLARHARCVTAGPWDIDLAQLEATDVDMGLPAGWIVGNDGTGHTMLIVRPDGRTLEFADDDPDFVDGEQYPSLWHALLVAIREDER